MANIYWSMADANADTEVASLPDALMPAPRRGRTACGPADTPCDLQAARTAPGLCVNQRSAVCPRCGLLKLCRDPDQQILPAEGRDELHADWQT